MRFGGQGRNVEGSRNKGARVMGVGGNRCVLRCYFYGGSVV